jgi:pantoate--beta-alanine ligase
MLFRSHLFRAVRRPAQCRPMSNQAITSTDIKIFKTVSELRSWRKSQLVKNASVGLVPTMGALHGGHLDLVAKSMDHNNSTVVSVFVNPSQFAPHEDLSSYPRTLDADIRALEGRFDRSRLAIFLPSVGEMYPSGIPLEVAQQSGAFVEVKGLSEQLEGSVRPHFFRGVATIVTKLLNIVTPEKAYFGQKDIQQTVVVKRLVKDLILPSEIVVVPTTRESNGLAMSSRNVYLSDESREKSKVFYQALLSAKNLYKSKIQSEPNGRVPRKIILDAAHRVLEPFTSPGAEFPIEIEYICLSDKETLQELEAVSGDKGGIISAAIRVPNAAGSKTRIIDNVLLD